MSFATFPSRHDPDSQEDWTFRFQLRLGESIVAASIDVVDENSQDVIGSDLSIVLVSFGVIAGTIWGVSAWVTGGGAQPFYYLRCRGQTDSAPLPIKFDRTMRLLCKQL